MTHLYQAKTARAWAIVLLTLCFASCGSLRPVTPQNVEEGVVASYVTLKATNDVFASMITVFSKQDAQRISDSLDSAGMLLRSSRECLTKDDLTAAEDYLKLAQELLNVVNDQLATAKKGR